MGDVNARKSRLARSDNCERMKPFPSRRAGELGLTRQIIWVTDILNVVSFMKKTASHTAIRLRGDSLSYILLV